jgi:hypothetical protein
MKWCKTDIQEHENEAMFGLVRSAKAARDASPDA